MKKQFWVVALALMFVVLVGVGACKKSDVVASYAIESFGKMVEVLPQQVIAENNSWVIVSPDKSSKFVWRQDFSVPQDNTVYIETDIKPFIEAGLDASKLPENIRVEKDKLIIGIDIGLQSSLAKNENITPVTSFAQIVSVSRSRIGYHSALDHYGIELDNGNMFEWAKDISTNDKDIVFVLNPQPFIDAGVNVSKVSGWIFAKVPVMDAKGKKVEVDKLLKPFDLK